MLEIQKPSARNFVKEEASLPETSIKTIENTHDNKC